MLPGLLSFLVQLGIVLSMPVEEPKDDQEKLRIICPNDGNPCFSSGNETFGVIKEGDIITSVQRVLDGDDENRNAVIDKERRWPGGVVPYIYHEDFSAKDKQRIEAAMTILEKNTCVKFVPYKQGSSDKRVVFITDQKGCRATVGYQLSGRRHNLNLDPKGCLGKTGTILHEMLHVLGLKHEHARPDRDGYIRIIWENIKDGHQKNFIKASPKEYTTFGIPYNYKSVMHYRAVSFSKNGKPTIVPLDRTVDTSFLGQRERASELDLKKINIMYNCKDFL